MAPWQKCAWASVSCFWQGQFSSRGDGVKEIPTSNPSGARKRAGGHLSHAFLIPHHRGVGKKPTQNLGHARQLRDLLGPFGGHVSCHCDL